MGRDTEVLREVARLIEKAYRNGHAEAKLEVMKRAGLSKEQLSTVAAIEPDMAILRMIQKEVGL